LIQDYEKKLLTDDRVEELDDIIEENTLETDLEEALRLYQEAEKKNVGLDERIRKQRTNIRGLEKKGNPKTLKAEIKILNKMLYAQKNLAKLHTNYLTLVKEDGEKIPQSQVSTLKPAPAPQPASQEHVSQDKWTHNSPTVAKHNKEKKKNSKKKTTKQEYLVKTYPPRGEVPANILELHGENQGSDWGKQEILDKLSTVEVGAKTSIVTGHGGNKVHSKGELKQITRDFLASDELRAELKSGRKDVGLAYFVHVQCRNIYQGGFQGSFEVTVRIENARQSENTTKCKDKGT
jgi:hypothetical protein